mmetsp:Transcript_29260/g.83132  ORF Transcript_29260/g.83132 Transcript_29260/m.83132 type:complete len:92 (-) Transcript_29260:857-1132(-)
MWEWPDAKSCAQFAELARGCTLGAASHLRDMVRILGGWQDSCVTWLERGRTTGRVWQPPSSKLHLLALFSMSSCLGARMTGTGVGGACRSW